MLYAEEKFTEIPKSQKSIDGKLCSPFFVCYRFVLFRYDQKDERTRAYKQHSVHAHNPDDTIRPEG